MSKFQSYQPTFRIKRNKTPSQQAAEMPKDLN